MFCVDWGFGCGEGTLSGPNWLGSFLQSCMAVLPAEEKYRVGVFTDDYEWPQPWCTLTHCQPCHANLVSSKQIVCLDCRKFGKCPAIKGCVLPLFKDLGRYICVMCKCWHSLNQCSLEYKLPRECSPFWQVNAFILTGVVKHLIILYVIPK